MPSIMQSIPVLPAIRVADSLDYYVNKLGFTETFRDADKPSYAGLRRDSAALHLTHCEGDLARTVGEQTMCRFQVDDVESYYAEVKGRGTVIHPNGPLQTKPWGTREFAVIDPCGVCITFFSPA